MLKRLTWLEFAIALENENFENYIEFMEETILNEQSQLEQSYGEYIKNYPPEDHDQIFEYMYEDKFYNIRQVYPKIMRTSALISQYSYLEKTLNTISKECERNYNLSISPEDIRHNGVKKYLFYLHRVVGLNINDTEILWQKIYAYNQIRNRFVHSPEENYTVKEKATFEQKVRGLSFEQNQINTNIYKLKSVEKEINIDFLELLTQSLEIVSDEIKKKDKELGQ
ncbi:hypothetical protein [Lysinibacillus varians]|uniref:Cthe-2314-like HEPN domain-containing protein n=1 Tax=Lysinibacillus varians TaxID=1145276 RepID=A0ABY2T565_9BACI|nr:hypothetical protein [Lysinibacillus varians]AHN24418.1 hypothetical protein T479_17010 [Lysinibacillus varians]TKI51133.1 hypothetical protein FC752_22490 [Lysinibacillus varians]